MLRPVKTLALPFLAVLLFGFTGAAHAQQRDSRDDDWYRDQNRNGTYNRDYDYGRNDPRYNDPRYNGPRYNDRDAYDNGRNGRGYDSRNGNVAFDNGYRDGIEIGQKDSQKRKAFRPDKNDRYEDADRGYNKQFGNKNDYKREYRNGFERGYSEGYGGRRYNR